MKHHPIDTKAYPELAWAYSVPSSWTIKKLGYMASLQSGEGIESKDIEDSGEYPVYGGNGLRGYTSNFTHEGERLLIGRQGALCGNINYAQGQFWATEHALVATPREPFFTKWLGSLLWAMNLNQYSISAAQPGLAADVISRLRIPVPPLNEQRTIASYLGRETKRLDELVHAKEGLLELLAEKRRALIASAVIRGLNPMTRLRNSGITWLGLVPEHWELERAKWLFTERDQRSTTGEEEMLTVSHITGVTPRSEKNVNMFEAESNEGCKLCQPGDLIINTLWAWMGAMGTARVPGMVSPAYNVYIPNERLIPDYVDALVRIPVFAQEAIRFSKGVWSSRLRLYPEGLYEIWLPVPPLAEQHAIVAHIATETAKLDKLRASAERTIALLKERRSALITAAVTGKLQIHSDQAHANRQN